MCEGVWGERLWMRASLPRLKKFKDTKEKLRPKRKGKGEESERIPR